MKEHLGHNSCLWKIMTVMITMMLVEIDNDDDGDVHTSKF